MTAPVRVLWLTKGLGWGGVERLLAASARHVARERYTVEVAYVLPWKDGLVPEFQAAGIPVHSLGGRGWPLRLRRLINEREYDIVHTHAPVPAVVARLLGNRRTRIVHTEHNLWPRYRLPTRWANALTYRCNDAVIAVSCAVADTIAPPGFGSSPQVNVVIHGIQHGRGSNDRAAARDRLGLPHDAFVIGTVGNLTAKKDHRTLLAAMDRFRAGRADAGGPRTVMAVIVGTGPLDADLRQHASLLGLSRDVIFAGLRPDVPEILPAFDVFTLSSRHEGLPVALMEAMAAGLPIVATDAGGIPEIVTDGVEGLLCRPGDPDALAARFATIAMDSALRDRLATAARARSTVLDISVAQRRIEDIYAAVLARDAVEAPLPSAESST